MFKTYIIRDKNSSLSNELSRDVYEKGVSLNYNPLFFDAIVGEDVDVFLKKENIKYSNDGDFSINRGTRGCFASHFSLWKECVKTDIPFVILEHDGMPVRDVSSIIEKVKYLCHLDGNVPFNSKIPLNSKEHFKVYNKKIEEKNEYDVSTHPKNAFYGDYKLTGSCFMGAYGYIIKPEGAKKIIEFAKKHGGRPADKALCENACYIQRAKSTFVKLHPFYDTLQKQRQYTTRTNEYMNR